MKAEQVDQALQQKFVADGERLVFWHDPNGEFAEYVGEILSGDISDVQVLDVAQTGGLSAKLQLERDDVTGRYLIYSQGEPPPADEDWLLDIRLYSAQFHADMASLWLEELGLAHLSLRNHLEARAIFLRSQERLKKLARFTGAEDDEATLDLKMMAVVVGSSVVTPFEVLRAVYHGHSDGDDFDLTRVPECVESLKKTDLLDSFWGLMAGEFAYNPDEPTVAGLLRQLFVSELLHEAQGASLVSIEQHQLPARGRRNAVVFLTQWRDSSAMASSYDAAAAAVAAEQNLSDDLGTLDLDQLKEVFTFFEVEKRVVSILKERVLSERDSVDAEAIADLVSMRKAGHWLSGPGSDIGDRRAVKDAYEAIVAAADLFALHTIHRQQLTFDSAEDLLTAYASELHRFDRLYRSFSTRAKAAMGQGWDLLKTLAEEVERVYDQGFLQPFGVEWSRLLDEGFLGKWSFEDMPSQQDFYASTIRPHLQGAERKRAFVIISDAFRYEAARELTESMNGRFRMNASLSAMLGVLPSYTALGKASLLPHERLSLNEQADVLVDDKSVARTETRGEQLESEEGMACQASELLVKKVEDARSFTQGKRVVYIYHDVVDTRAESSEEETFDAIADCIEELIALVQFCVNKLNAGKVWVTADHGFLFQREALDATDKSVLSHKPEGTVKSKNRYVLGRDLGVSPEAHYGTTDITAGTEEGMDFWVPRAANRFHFGGGARYVHGGAMPQEVVVPLVTVTHLRGKKKDASRSEKVSVQVLGSQHKITTPAYRFDIIQTEAVSDRRKAITLRVAVYEGAQAVTSVESVTFDSASTDIEDRKKSIRLELQSGTFDKSKPYRLVLRDVETDAEVQFVLVVIDRSFDDDF
jgi:uncharacterized protein (TIGR02687 family)